MYYGDKGAITPVSMNKTERNTPLKKMYNASENFLATLTKTEHRGGAGANGPSVWGTGFAGSSSATGATNLGN